MPEIERRRRRPAISCVLCRKRKIKCNRETPCNNCIKSRSGTCVYEASPFNTRPVEAVRPLQPNNSSNIEGLLPQDSASQTSTESLGCIFPTSSVGKSSASSVTKTSSSTREVEVLEDRIKQLESQLRQQSLQEKLATHLASSQYNTVNVPSELPTTIASGLGESYFIHGDRNGSSQPMLISRSVSHKTRLFGQSHWINTVVFLSEVFHMVESDIMNGSTALVSGINTSKHLARVIKASRKPPWPLPLTTELPPKTVADELLDCYLRTIEPVYRILHIPTLRRDYDALWMPDAAPDMAFIVQLKLIFAIGSTIYDDTFSLRASAARWIYEAQTFLSEPVYKPRLQIQYLQTDILLLIARELADVGGELVWISAGSLVRKAMYMGLHKDPTRLPKMTLFAAEMRRRLWNTILEISLQTSLTSGGPPLVSLDNYDSEPPSNFDDEQLLAENPVPKPAAEYTQTSVARALRSSFPARLAVIKLLNDINACGTYTETLRLDRDLRSAYKVLRQNLAQFKAKGEQLPELRTVDFLLYRYLSALHVPYFGPALRDTAYAFSRKVVVETSMKLWRTAYPESCTEAHEPSNTAMAPTNNWLQRLSISTPGMFSTVLYQAAIVIAIELATVISEEESLNPLPLRPDLLSVLKEAKYWCLFSIKVGETSVKGYVVASLLETYVQLLMAGTDKEAIVKNLVQDAEKALEVCIPILEETVAQLQCDVNNMQDLPENWDMLSMPPGAFQNENSDPMSWIFNDGGALFM